MVHPEFTLLNLHHLHVQLLGLLPPALIPKGRRQALPVQTIFRKQVQRRVEWPQLHFLSEKRRSVLEGRR